MVREGTGLSLSRRCELAGVSRASVYYRPAAAGIGDGGTERPGANRKHKLRSRAFIHQEAPLALPSNCLNDPDHFKLSKLTVEREHRLASSRSAKM